MLPGLTEDKADGLLSFDILFNNAAAVVAELLLQFALDALGEIRAGLCLEL